MRSCAKSIAIMVVRFHPKESLFFSATSIAKALEAMDHGNSGSLFAAVDSIKLGLKSPIIRKALSYLYPNQFHFEKSEQLESRINPGEYRFQHGFQIMFTETSEKAVTNASKQDIILAVELVMKRIMNYCESR